MRILICGVGGQGVVLLARMLCETAVRSGKQCLSSEFHGMSRMMGSVRATVKIGNYHSPEIDGVDLLIGLDPGETSKYISITTGRAVTLGETDGAESFTCKSDFPNTFMLGVVCRVLSLQPRVAKAVIRGFGKMVDENILSFEEGYGYEA